MTESDLKNQPPPFDIEDGGIHEYRIPIGELDFNEAAVERGMGYENGSAPDFYREKITETIALAADVVEIRAGYRILPSEQFLLEKEQASCCRQTFQTGKIIARQLKNSRTVALFASTAGAVFDKWSKELFNEGDFPGGYVVDCVGSEIVESAADWLEQRLIEQLASQNLKITNRFSPGYCGWDVFEQHKLFSLLPPEFLGIRLTESALMVPVKSVSGFIGVGENVKRLSYPCAICDMKNCFRRRQEKRHQ